MPMASTVKMTATEFFEWSNLPENQHRNCELYRGEVVDVPSPGFAHGIIAALMTRILLNYAFARGSGSVTSNDTGLVIAEDTVLGPDLMFFANSVPLGQLPNGHARAIPLLCVEILSPSNRMTEMMRKVNQYLRLGVKLVWLIDPDERSVHVFRPDELPKLLDDTDTLSGNGVLADFACPVADLFRLPGTAG